MASNSPRMKKINNVQVAEATKGDHKGESFFPEIFIVPCSFMLIPALILMSFHCLSISKKSTKNYQEKAFAAVIVMDPGRNFLNHLSRNLCKCCSVTNSNDFWECKSLKGGFSMSHESNLALFLNQ